MKQYISDAQGQLTLQSVMGSDRHSDSSMLLCMSWLPTRMKKKVKMNVLEWSKHYTAISWAAKFVVGGQVWPKINLIQAFMVVLLTCNNEEDPFKNKGARVVTTDLSL